MPDLEWYDAVALLTEHIFKISTPSGFGTGFVLAAGEPSELCSIATAAHVIDHAHRWEEPIRLDHYASGQSVLLHEGERAIAIDPGLDTAALTFVKHGLPLPEVAHALTPEGMRLAVGCEVGWVGFPAMSPDTPCFFSGRISAYLSEKNSYLVDGVAINGVSGGPAIVIEEDAIMVIGVVSAYIPNRATGEPLPGLCLLSDVTHLQMAVTSFKSLEEAKEEEGTAGAAPQADTEEAGDAHGA